MDYLPLFANVAQRPVLLVGGGEVALRKARLLLEAEARVTVVAPELHDELQQLQQQGRLTHQADYFQAAHLQGQRLVIAATDDEQVNADVAAAAEAAGLWVNVVDDPARSSFIFPSIIDRSPIIVAISSGGAAPVLARLLRERLEASVDATGAQLRGSETVEAPAGWVRARVSAAMPESALLQWLARLSSTPPYLSLESLTIGTAPGGARSPSEQLDVTLEATLPLAHTNAR